MDLFASLTNEEVWEEVICPGAVVLRQFAIPESNQLLTEVEQLVAYSPFRKMITPGGFTMSAGLSSCGDYGWVSDRQGYRYESVDPSTARPWPAMPVSFRNLAVKAAQRAGYPDFEPDACLINCYEPGAKMSLHQDKNEQDYAAPIVSVSLGVFANFQFGGLQRSDKPVKIPLVHGDVVVWGGTARLNFHGVLPLREGYHPLTGDKRINLTFRKVT